VLSVGSLFGGSLFIGFTLISSSDLPLSATKADTTPWEQLGFFLKKESPWQQWWIILNPTKNPTKVMKVYSLISTTYNPSANPATTGRLLKKMVAGGEKSIPTDTGFVADEAQG
jgi:hypothetical protein